MPTPVSVPTSRQSFLQHPIGSALPRVGEWLWTCRPGSETDLCEELTGRRVSARIIEPGLVAGSKCPPDELVFARQGLPVQATWVAPLEQLAMPIAKDAPIVSRIVDEIVNALAKGKPTQRPLALHVFAADSDAGRARAKLIAALASA